MHFLSSIPAFIADFGYAGIFGIVFLESSVVLGAFLPGDSFLFLTGILAGKNVLVFVPLLATIITAAILGNEFGFWLGKKYGWAAVSVLSKKYADHSHHEKIKEFYKKWGVFAVVIARFVPVVRSLIATTAGMADMPRKHFTAANIAGAVVWGVSIPTLGYIFGEHIDGPMLYIVPTVGFLVVGIGVPLALRFFLKKHA
jgi:membrane-associated protein